MSAKKSKKEEQELEREINYDPTELEDRLNEETQPVFDASMETELERRLNEKFGDAPSPEPTNLPNLTVKAPYVHVYERVTNGGKVVGVLRQGAKVIELSRTFNWVEIQSDANPDLRGFVKPQTLE